MDGEQIYVVDRSSLGSSELIAWLRESPTHRAALMDLTGIELYLDNDIERIADAVVPLARFARQIIVIKSMIHLHGLPCGQGRFRRRMRELEHTSGFGRFCSEVGLARNGDAEAVAAIVQRRTWAREYRVGVERGLSLRPDAMRQMQEELPKQRLKEFRATGVIRPDLAESIRQRVLQLAIPMLSHLVDTLKVPRPRQILDTFVFRVVVANVASMLHYAKNGADPRCIAADKHRNDQIDCNYIAMATLLDGYHTKDDLAKPVHDLSVRLLREIFPEARAPEGASRPMPARDSA